MRKPAQVDTEGIPINSPIQSGDRIVLIGDSITDAERRVDPEGLGYGYVRLMRDLFVLSHPELEVEWINQGISGNTIVDLEHRWHQDVLALKPQWVSISIGINDVWRQLDKQGPGVKLDAYEATYQKLIDWTKQAGIGLILMEPSIIVENANSPGNRLLSGYVDCVRRLAKEHHARLVPIHQACLEYLEKRQTPPLTTDGVHLSSTGTALFAQVWTQALGIIPRD